MRTSITPSPLRNRATALAFAAVLTLGLVPPQASGAEPAARGFTSSIAAGIAVSPKPAVAATSGVLTQSTDATPVLDSGSEIAARYAGGGFAAIVASGEAEPTSAAVGDVDADGVADLVVGYTIGDEGAIALHRGNASAIYPNSPSARERVDAGNPFHADATVYAIGLAVDFVATGDFDADGRIDVAVASKRSAVVTVLGTDAEGALEPLAELSVGGVVTALEAGDFGRRDAATDLAVGVDTGDGWFLSIFGSPAGAISSAPSTISLAAPATALEFGRFDSAFAFDLAVASGSDLLVVHGSSSNFASGTEGVVRRSFAAPIVDLASSRARGTAVRGLALLTSDGSVLTLDPRQSPDDLSAWPVTQTTAALGAGMTRLLAADLTDSAEADYVLLDEGARRLHVVSGSAVATKAIAEPIVYDVDAAPVAAATMRLDDDAMSDIVLVRRGRGAPAVVNAARGIGFTVTTNADSGPGSLRQAILDTNALPGADTITFALPPNNLTITLATPLPAVTSPVTIDATTQAGYNGTPIVEIVGSSIVGAAQGLVVQAGSSIIRGLVINRFNGTGIILQTLGNNIVENCYIGTNVAGTVDLGNAAEGVLIADSPDNLIGGGTAQAFNLISGNGSAGVLLTQGTSDANGIAGNNIGTNANGTSAIPNSGSGIQTGIGVTNTIVGGNGAALNLISGNLQNGIFVGATGGSGTLIVNNDIGVNADNSGALPNALSGVLIDGTNTTVANSRVAFNGDDGIFVGTAGTGNTFTVNSIHNNGELGIDLFPNGPTPNDAGDADTGANNLQNFPVLTGAEVVGGTTVITGSLSSVPSTQYVVQIFSNTACDPSGFGEGATFLAQTTVTTNANGIANFSVTVNTIISSALSLTSTATNPAGSTSEFSACVSVASDADVALTIDAPDEIVPVGQTVAFTYTITNAGPLTAQDVLLLTSTPSGTTFVSMQTSQGTCTVPPVGAIGSIACNVGAIAPGGTVTAVLTVRLVGPAPLTLLNTAFAIPSTPDPDINNNVAIATVATVEAPEITSIERLSQPFRIKINGINFQPGVQVFIGNDPNPWPNVRFKSDTMLVVKKGGQLKARFPNNVPVTIRVVNPDGGEDSATFTR